MTEIKRLLIYLDMILTNDQALVIASEVTDNISNKLGRDLGSSYNNISPKGQALIIDAKFNTGKNYTKLAKAVAKYEKSKSSSKKQEALVEMIKESRRTTGPKGNRETHKGLDNRVVKLMFDLGYLKPSKENVAFINKNFNAPGKASWDNIKGFYS